MGASADIASFVAAFVDEVNTGQIDAALRRFSNEATIVEDIAPFSGTVRTPARSGLPQWPQTRSSSV